MEESEATARADDSSEQRQRMSKRFFSAVDVATMAIFGCLMGVTSAQIANLISFAKVFGFWGEQLFQGLFMVIVIIVCFLVKKPGAGLITGLISGFVEIIAGNPLGVIIIPFTVLEGLGADIGFGLFKYRRFDILAFFVAGFMYILTAPYSIYMFYSFLLSLPPIGIILFTASQALSGGFVGGLVSRGIAKILDKSGLTGRYSRIGKSS